MKSILLTKGHAALVDDVDYDFLNQWNWFYSSGYARRDILINGKNYPVFMHRILLPAPPKTMVDHINGNPLDNRKENLRVATFNQNAYNKRVNSSTKSSRFKGVCWHKRYSLWQAQIVFQGTRTYLGRFPTELEAARAYNIAAQKLFGEFASLNALVE